MGVIKLIDIYLNRDYSVNVRKFLLILNSCSTAFRKLGIHLVSQRD